MAENVLRMHKTLNILEYKMKILLLTFGLFVTFIASAQKETVSGKAYRFVQYFNDNNHFITGSFIFKKADQEIENAYKLITVSEKINNKELIHGIWIIDAGQSFYLNIYRYGFGFPKCFVKFEKKGNYYYFKASRLMSVSQQQRIINSQLMFGFVGAGVTASQIAKQNAKYRHNVLNFSQGTIQTLTMDYITDLLTDYPQLYKEFNNEEKKESIKTLKAYLEKVNNEND